MSIPTSLYLPTSIDVPQSVVKYNISCQWPSASEITNVAEDLSWSHRLWGLALCQRLPQKPFRSAIKSANPNNTVARTEAPNGGSHEGGLGGGFAEAPQIP